MKPSLAGVGLGMIGSTRRGGYGREPYTVRAPTRSSASILRFPVKYGKNLSLAHSEGMHDAEGDSKRGTPPFGGGTGGNPQKRTLEGGHVGQRRRRGEGLHASHAIFGE